MVEQPVATWCINHRVTLKGLDALPPEALKATANRPLTMRVLRWSVSATIRFLDTDDPKSLGPLFAPRRVSA
jgi:hypothetical protein